MGRLHRANFCDILSADIDAFCLLNPWEMLRVGPHGVKARPAEPLLEWWAKLNALVTSSELQGRKWQWTERSSQHGKAMVLHVRHVVYCLTLGADKVTVTMRAMWNDIGI